MKRLAVFLFCLIWTPLRAADPPGFVQWSGSTLRDYEKKLAPKINAQKVATEQLGDFGNHSVMVAHRQGSGEAELHETKADIFVVQSGQAVLVVGGNVVGGKSTGAGEIRGSSIAGGERKWLAAGDIIHIPAKVPHQLLLENSRQFTYFIVKIDSK